ncbi:TPA: hypothetical protein JLC50_004706 [Escherichia coli]|nr:hypothetical protein [Escherichia coli]HEC5166113.1 hypothetical protein [Escherichia coli]HEC5174925.1 hypothetical protein [Escherichia coli]
MFSITVDERRGSAVTTPVVKESLRRVVIMNTTYPAGKSAQLTIAWSGSWAEKCLSALSVRRVACMWANDSYSDTTGMLGLKYTF